MLESHPKDGRTALLGALGATFFFAVEWPGGKKTERIWRNGCLEMT